MYKSLLVITLILAIVNTTSAQTITNLSVREVSPLLVSIQFDEVAVQQTGFDSNYVITNFGEPIYSTIDFSNTISVFPGESYSFQVCRNLTDTPLTACSDTVPFNVALVSSITIIPKDATFATLVFTPTFVVATEIDQYTDFYYSLDFLNGATWESLATTKRDTEAETPSTHYLIPFETTPGQQRLYRISLGREIRSDSFFYTPSPIVKDDDFNGQDIVTFNPTSLTATTPNAPSVSASDFIVAQFDLSTLSQECNILAGRLNINTNSLSTYSGGFLQAYSQFSNDVPVDYAFSMARATSQFQPIYDESESNIGKAVLDFDNNIPSEFSAINVFDDWRNEINNNGLLLQLLKSDEFSEMHVTDISDITLEIALENPLPALESSLSFMALNLQAIDENGAPNCGSSTCINAIPPSVVDPIPVISAQFNDILSSSSLLIAVDIQLDGVVGQDDTFISIALEEGAITDESINLGTTFECNNPEIRTFSSPSYSVADGGFPGYKYGGLNTIYIQSSGAICISDIIITLHFLENPLENGCDPNIPPTPSTTPSPTPSVSFGFSVSSSPTPSPSPSQTPIPSSIVGPSSDPSPPPAPSNNPVASVVQSSEEQDSSASPSPSVNPSTTVQVQPTTVPADEEVVDIEDTNGNTIGVVDLGNGEGEDGDTLVITPVGTEGLPDVQDIASAVVSLVLVDVFGNEVQPTDTVEICLEAGDAGNDACLGFLDESRNPPEWVCEDRCLSSNSNGQLCGNTEHFTSFAVLFNGGGGDACSSSGDDYIIGSWQDGVLIGSITVAFCCFLLVITLLLAFTPCGSKIVRGKEGHRISRLRTSNATQLMDTEV